MSTAAGPAYLGVVGLDIESLDTQIRHLDVAPAIWVSAVPESRLPTPRSPGWEMCGGHDLRSTP
jgi:hypothetical protein